MKAAKFNPVTLLKMMGGALNEEECEKAMKVVLESARSGERALFNELSDPEIRAFQTCINEHLVKLSDSGATFEAEELFFARIACATAQESADLTATQKDEIINKVAPDIPVVSEIFQRHSVRLITALQEANREKEDEECFVCLQLLQLAKVAGLQEEGSRRHFSGLMQGTLSSGETPEDLVEGCVDALRVAHEDENQFLETISQVVSDLLAAEDDASDGVDTLRTLRVLSILTIVLEKASPRISSHPLLQDFAKVIVTAVTNSNALVREAGVSCFGKLGLFSEEIVVMADFKPILLSVAVNEDEKLEIRSQAMLALSDWAMLFSEILQPCQIEDETFSFLGVVKEMLQHTNPSVAAIAAEVAAKLQFSGRVCESSLLAHLLVLFFDPDQEASENDDIKEVGSFARLQQLLSIFFPAYCIKSEHGRTATLGAIECAIGLANNRKAGKSKKRKLVFPVVKMVEFVCSVVDAGEAAAVSNESNVPSTPKSVGEESVPATDSNTALLTAIQVAQSLVNENSLTATQSRGLCKFLGSLEIMQGDAMCLRKLKEQMEELGMVLTDGTCLRYLSALNEQLDEIEIAEEEPVDEDDVSSQGTVTEAGSTGETTVEDSLMDSMAGLSVKNKENVKRASQGKANRSSLPSSSRRSAGSVSVLESLGSN
jgi:hypothetical protein